MIKGTLVYQPKAPTILPAIDEGQRTLTFRGIINGGGAPYQGEYVVEPSLESNIVLATKNRSMSDDVTVLEIPQYEVSNSAGGITFIIGKEVQING
jgi:hypothetical protein